MPEHRIATQEEWQAERDALLAEEKELTRRSDELARKRRELPWVPVEKDYRFETEHGTQVARRALRRPLAAARLPLHVRARPTRPAAPSAPRSPTRSPRRSVHLKARDTTLLLASRAPLEKLLAYRERMGWGIEWVSSGGSDFNRDLGFLSHRGGAAAVPRGRDPPDRRADGRRPPAPTSPATSPRGRA